jgi:peptidoglycan-binding protein ArfA
MHFRLRKLAVCAAVLGGLRAATPGSVAPSLRLSPDTSDKIQALENYQLITLKSVRFGSQDSRLSLGDRTALSEMAKRFGQPGNVVIEIRGYADGGSVEQDLTVSAERATAVARFLTNHGVPPERIFIIGLGAVDPAGPRSEPEHQRVDIRIFAPSTESGTLKPAA